MSELNDELDRERRFDLRAPPAQWRWLEARALAETASLLPAAPWLSRQPRGQGEAVLVIPGFASSDAVTGPLRWYLRRLGYEPHPWGLGINRGEPERDAERLAPRLDALGPGPVSLVGWSLGGVVARLVARARPERVRQVITLGTPVEGGPKYTLARSVFERRWGDLDAFEAHVHHINAEGLRVPLTVVYSRADGVVGWSAAVDRYNPHARHVVLRTASHLGLALQPRGWIEVARALADPPPAPDLTGPPVSARQWSASSARVGVDGLALSAVPR